MKSLRSWRFARIASLVTAVSLLCSGTFLSLPTTGADVPASLVMAGSPHVVHGANGHTIDGPYLAALADDAEGSDEVPVHAALLTTLLLVVFFGTVLGWLLAFGQTRLGCQVPSLIGSCFHSIGRRHQRRPLGALLGIFRL
jgi:hypothetical protein